MISSLYFGAILLGLVINNARGQPNITSTVQPLSGELCPGTVIFTCNWLDTVSNVIDFYVDATRLVSYRYELAHTFPHNVTPVPSGFMAQISSAELSGVNNKLNYLNFTISVHLNDLKSYQGQDISCGSLTERSNVIPIGNYSTRDLTSILTELLNIRSSVVYVGLELKLSEIIVVWDNLTFADDCLQNILYEVELIDRNTKRNGSYNCNSTTCSATFLLGNEREERDIFYISITAFSDTQNFSSDQIPLNTSLANIFEIRNGTNCEQKIVCPSNNNCTLQYRESESYQYESLEVDQEWDINSLSGKRIYFLNITTQMDSVTFMAQIIYTADNPRRNYTGFVGVGVAFMILGFIIEILGSAVVVYWVIHCIIKSSVGLKVFVCIHCMSWLLVILSLSLWISYGVVNDPGSCTSGPEEPIAIVATVISILLAVVSVVITGALVLKCTWRIRKSSVVKEKLNPNQVSYDDEGYKLLFGKEYTTKASKAKDTHNCICGARFEDVTNMKDVVNKGATQLNKWKLAIVKTFKSRKDLPSTKPEVTEVKKKCRACPNNRCSNCLRSAFRKQTLKWELVCEVCYGDHEKEKERILKLPKVGLFEPVQQEYNGICYECESTEKKKELEYCPGCGHWACGNCIVAEDPVYLQYSNEHEQVCRNCYALTKIRSGNSNSEGEDAKEVNDNVAQETQPEIMQGSLKATPKEDKEEVTDKLSYELQVKVVPGNFVSEHIQDCKKDKELGKEKLPTQMKALQHNQKSTSKEGETEGISDEVLNAKL